MNFNIALDDFPGNDEDLTKVATRRVLSEEGIPFDRDPEVNEGRELIRLLVEQARLNRKKTT